MNRLKHDAVRARLEPLIQSGLVATCAVLELEALYSAQSPDDYERLRAQRNAIFSYVETGDDDWQEALKIQRTLASKSMHRVLKIPDSIIAVVAIRQRLTVLHYDSDFDHIAQCSTLSAEWVVPKGSVA